MHSKSDYVFVKYYMVKFSGQLATKFRNLKSTVFWGLATCNFVAKYQSFELACGLHLQSQIAHSTVTVFRKFKAVKIWLIFARVLEEPTALIFRKIEEEYSQQSPGKIPLFSQTTDTVTLHATLVLIFTDL